MEKEIWKDILGCEGKYQISSNGKVRSLNYNKTGKIKELVGGKDKDGYVSFCLWIDGKQTVKKAHRIVAETFIGKYESKNEIDHINGDRQDNRVENLRWCTHKENINNPNTINKKKRKYKP